MTRIASIEHKGQDATIVFEKPSAAKTALLVNIIKDFDTETFIYAYVVERGTHGWLYLTSDD